VLEKILGKEFETGPEKVLQKLKQRAEERWKLAA
jgi:hypothetical protein